MALADALAAIVADWPAVNQGLDPKQRDSARRLLAAIAHGTTPDVRQLLQVLLAHEPDDHPAWRALESRSRRGPVTGPSTASVAMQLRQLIELSGPGDFALDPSAIEAEAEHSVWLVPMESVEHLPPRDRPLILERGGRIYAPRFQFDAHGHLRPEASQVNELLDAVEDPWGAASWWLAPHAALHAIPADALVAGRAEEVIAAAAAAPR